MSTNAKESAGKNIKYPWWYGGAAGIFATMVTHPLDLAKVRLQAAPMPKPTLFRMLESILANEGVVGLYSGLSAAVLRQCTYTAVRFGAYDLLKENVIPREQLTNMAYLLPCSMFSGAIGGLAGNFADAVNIRMQNDSALEAAKRRNYKNAIDGVYKIYRYEGGLKTLFTGWKPNMVRGILMTASQVVTYDVFKNYLVTKLDFDASKNYTHLTASLLAGLVATTVCSPADVMKTRIMNGSGDHQPALKILADAVRKEGPSFMFRGWLPSFTRLGPFTMLIFFAIEQLKKHRVGMPKEDK
ncbi:BGP_1a_G0037890.mRNA.1.CDS.1 [Saccharomyces cerevisiae]|nr:BGP_1a_G0037890.mRNA.1.CDS.1 [Saccharomyces cerevisiae]CAI7212738.1 BGP_1a_G0037890.mRNA.1.CDS.1 [Saccharomyces cerevisiae]